jgi:DNA-binding transcriptional LysR family regulator
MLGLKVHRLSGFREVSMDNKRLRYFVQIVDSGSITRAAAGVGIAQSALSQQVVILEHELRTKLLDRSVTGVTPTVAGRLLYAHAQTVLREYEELRRAVHRESSPLSGTVSIGMLPSMVPRFGLPLIEKVCIQHPEIHLQIIEAGNAVLQELLTNGRIELSVSATRSDDDSLFCEEALSERLMLVYPAAWTVAERPSLADIAPLPWVVTRRPHSIRTLVDAVFAASNLTPHVVVEIDSLYTVIEAVKRGFGVTVLPLGAIKDSAVEVLVRWQPFGDAPVTRHVYLSHRRRPGLAPPAQFVLNVLSDLGTELRADVADGP